MGDYKPCAVCVDSLMSSRFNLISILFLCRKGLLSMYAWEKWKIVNRNSLLDSSYEQASKWTLNTSPIQCRSQSQYFPCSGSFVTTDKSIQEHLGMNKKAASMADRALSYRQCRTNSKMSTERKETKLSNMAMASLFTSITKQQQRGRHWHFTNKYTSCSILFAEFTMKSDGERSDNQKRRSKMGRTKQCELD